jgi:GDP-L-fucose synthase
MTNNTHKKSILVTGSEGLIGKELIELLKIEEPETNIVYADLSFGIDLRFYDVCLNIMKGVSEVYSLVGIKGSPKKTKEKPASFFVPMLQFNTNLLEAARINKVKKFLYTSSIAVLNPQTDLFPSYAKKAGEMQIDAYKIEHPEFGNNCVIVRPANVYGRYDNFNNTEAMVVTSLIRKALTENVIEVWGDGSELREFISAKDVAKGMILAMKKQPSLPINLGGGEMHSIKELAEILSEVSGKEIKYLIQEQKGDKKRVVFEDENQGDIGFKATDSFKESIIEAYEYAKQNYFKE